MNSREYYLANRDRVLEAVRNYRKANREKVNKKRREYVARKKDEVKVGAKSYYLNNKEAIAQKKKLHYERNKEAILSKAAEYFEKNKEAIKKSTQCYKKNNRDKVNQNARRYNKQRRKSDILFSCISRIRSRTSTYFKKIGQSKPCNTQKLLGADWLTVKHHIEKQFVDGMNWDNRNAWHIDHIVPLASAKSIEEVMPLFHYTNLQPLWKEDNLKKGAKILPQI